MAQAYVQLKRSTHAAHPFIRGRHMPFATKEAISLLDSESDYTDILPFRPKGGEVYLFQPNDRSESQDWRSDGHRWYNNTRMDMPKGNPVVTKLYFYLETEQGINKEFRKQTLKFMGCDRQTNNRDCGLFSIANATELAFKGDPGTAKYANGDILRFHLIECLENRSISFFPRVGILDPRTQHCLVMKVPVFCACRMPEDNELYFSCLSCKKWFHAACQGLSHLTRTQVKKSRNIYCIRCSLKSRKNKK